MKKLKLFESLNNDTLEMVWKDGLSWFIPRNLSIESASQAAIDQIKDDKADLSEVKALKKDDEEVGVIYRKTLSEGKYSVTIKGINGYSFSKQISAYSENEMTKCELYIDEKVNGVKVNQDYEKKYSYSDLSSYKDSVKSLFSNIENAKVGSVDSNNFVCSATVNGRKLSIAFDTSSSNKENATYVCLRYDYNNKKQGVENNDLVYVVKKKPSVLDNSGYPITLASTIEEAINSFESALS